MFDEVIEFIDWRPFIAGVGLAVAVLSLVTFQFPMIFVGAGSSLLGVGEWINTKGRNPEGFKLGERQLRHAATLQRLGKIVAIIGGILIAEGVVKLFA